jgi:hypothetical protein
MKMEKDYTTTANYNNQRVVVGIWKVVDTQGITQKHAMVYSYNFITGVVVNLNQLTDINYGECECDDMKDYICENCMMRRIVEETDKIPF